MKDNPISIPETRLERLLDSIAHWFHARRVQGKLQAPKDDNWDKTLTGIVGSMTKGRPPV